MIGADIEITVLEVRGEQVRIGIQAPRNVSVHRKEIFNQIHPGEVDKEETPTSETTPVVS